MTETSIFARVASAVFYGITSVVVVFVNKILLTNYRFPSFQVVAVGQILATILILRIGKALKLIKFPDMERSTFRRIFPLPILYGLNLVSGLGGTQMINLPMFTVLRRFSILMTMILEFYILGVVATRAVRISVGLMILGSVVAAFYDLSFHALGYTLIFVNDICTAALGVYTKQKLEAKDLGKYGLMYYNCLFIVLPYTLFIIYTGDVERALIFFQSEDMTMSVWMCFAISCICGFVLNYSLVLCTQCNSALTTTCVGPIKNLFVTYVGMFSSGDFVFQWLNFTGINISVLGSILYTYVTFRTKSPSMRPTPVLPTTKSEKQPLI